MRRIALVVLVLLTGCRGYDTPVQSEAVTPTQAHMISRAQEWEPALGIGQFVLIFGKPWRATSAAEAGCPQSKAPWVVTINAEWIESERAQAGGTWYFDALLAHEMCHVWIEKQKRKPSCTSTEEEANICGDSLVTTGRPI